MISFFKMERIKSFGVLRGWYLGKFNMVLESDQAKLFEYKKKHFNSSLFLSLERYFLYQKGPYKKYGSAQIGLKWTFCYEKGGSMA